MAFLQRFTDMNETLLINACARPDSRTLALAKYALTLISDSFCEVNLYKEGITPLDYNALMKRDELISNRNFADSMFRFAKQFRDAGEIVIAAPYWDLSFPSVLKCYTESLCVNGLTFRYGENGQVIPLCRCKRLVYVTTSGGYIGDNNHGYDYVKALCNNLLGIENTVFVSAEGLDIYGNDIEKILSDAQLRIKSLLLKT